MVSAVDVDLDASNLAAIDATIASISAAIGGGTVGVGVAIGAAVANNFIGFSESGTRLPLLVQTYLRNSVVTASGALTQDAITRETITAKTLAGAVAVAGGLVGVAAAGSGVSTVNKIANRVASFMEGATTNVTANSVALTSLDNSLIEAESAAASVAASFAIGGAVAIAVTLSENVIENEVMSSISNATVIANTGNVALSASNNPTIRSSAVAGGVAVGLVAAAAAGVDARNRIGGFTLATVQNATVTTSDAGNLTVTSQSTARPTLNASGLAASVGTGAAVGVVLSTSIVTHSTEASAGGKLTVGGLTVTSNGTATPVSNSAAVAGGLLAAGVNLATAQATPTVKALIGDDSIIVVKRDAVVSSIADVTATATSLGRDFGAVSVGVSKSNVTLSPTVNTAIGERASITASGRLTVASNLLRNQGTTTANASGGKLLGASGAMTEQSTTSNIGTVVGKNAVLSGVTGLNVTSTANSQLNSAGKVEIGAAFSGQDASTEETIRTTAQTIVGNDASLASSDGTVNVTADNRIVVTSFAKTQFYGVGSLNSAFTATSITGTSDAKLAKTTLGVGSSIVGREVNVKATVPSINVDSDALGEMYALGGYIRVVSDVDVDSDTLITQMTNAQISANKISFDSSHSNINVDSLSKGAGVGIVEIVNGQVFDDVNINSDIVIQKDATLMGSDIAIVANAAGGTGGAGGGSVTQATQGGGGITDVQRDTLELSIKANSLVDVSGTFVAGPDTARLSVDAAGVIRVKDFVNARIDATTGDVVVDGLTSTPPSLRIEAVQPAIGGGGTQTAQVKLGSDASFQVPNRFRVVDFDNLSGKNLDINGIDVLIASNPAFTPTILPAPTSGSLVNKGVRSINSTTIEITNTQDREIFLDGAINNPSGRTSILSAGSISDRDQSAATQITTASLDLRGTAGHIGTAASPIQAIIVKGTETISTGPISTGVVSANAANEIAITLSNSNATEPVDLRGVTSSTGDILLDLGLKNVTLLGPVSGTKKVELKNVKNDHGRQ